MKFLGILGSMTVLVIQCQDAELRRMRELFVSHPSMAGLTDLSPVQTRGHDILFGTTVLPPPWKLLESSFPYSMNLLLL